MVGVAVPRRVRQGFGGVLDGVVEFTTLVITEANLVAEYLGD